MRVVVGGSRYQNNFMFICRSLEAIHSVTPITRVAHGNCKGTDLLVEVWAESKGIDFQAYPADWDTFGRSAGPRRNGDMLKKEQPDKVIAFPGGTGTADLVNKANHHRPAPVEVIRVGWHK